MIFKRLNVKRFAVFSECICSCWQDNYTFAQPGIQTKVNALRELVHRIDSKCCINLVKK